MRQLIPALILALAATGARATDVNGCDEDTLLDLTGQPSVQIAFGGGLGQRYSPACIRVSPGTNVTFNGGFSTHPLSGGTYDGVSDVIDPNSPIQFRDSGNSATFLMNRQGIFGYLCLQHYVNGMLGAIYVGTNDLFADGFE